MSTAVIEVRGLKTAFGSQVVHEDLNLSIERGEIVGMVGGSGSGKSVLMRAMLGLRRPQAGSIRVLGIDPLADDPIQRLAVERQTGVLFQGGALFSSLTVIENIMLPLREHHRLQEDTVHALAWMKMRLAGLPSTAADKLPTQLSGGMKKRAALARALALDPPLLFLDEPTAGLDPISAAAFDDLILTLKRSLGLTVLLITHDLDTLYATCDRVAVLADRHVVSCAPIADIEQIAHPWVQDYFHGPRGRSARRKA